MSEDWNAIKWLGPLATPIGIVLSLLALIATFQSHAATVGWKVVSSIVFVVSLVWSIWYLWATITKEPSGLAGVEPRKVFRHGNKLWRRVVFLLPIVTGVLCAMAFLQSKEEDYSSLLQGGGPYSPIVVFDSEPRGAEVRVAWSLYGEDDPWLESKSNDKIARLPDHTLTWARLGQGHYLVVFELNGKRVQKYVIVQGPTVVKVEF
jgi:hypothetical protein